MLDALGPFAIVYAAWRNSDYTEEDFSCLIGAMGYGHTEQDIPLEDFANAAALVASMRGTEGEAK